MTVLSHWKRVPADAAAWFDAEEIARGRSYNKPIERLNRVRFAFSTAVALAFILGEAGPRLLRDLDLRGWALEAVVVVVAFTSLEFVVGPWFDAWRELVHDRRWGLSTQTTGGFVADQLKNFLVGVVTSLVLLVPLWAVIRATDLWWLWGWLLFSAFTVLLGLLYPIVIAPLFNKFTPMDDEVLLARILGVARQCGLDISSVLVADASRRSLAGNAYVAGLGRTRRVVIYDTLLAWPHDVIVQVVAHELGHWKHAHLRRKLPVIIFVQLVLFLGSWALLQWGWLLDLGGVTTVRDPAAIPIFFTLFPAGFVAVNLVTSWLSRADERQADIYALDVLGDPDAFSQVFRRLAETNKADVDPSTWKRLNASHPPIAERLAMARRWQEVAP
ncbi:MAG: peptidase Ste24p [Acidimicrobiales bacterium]|nr:peptidase Ste24p [Acidimicrobiales bacterium]